MTDEPHPDDICACGHPRKSHWWGGLRCAACLYNCWWFRLKTKAKGPAWGLAHYACGCRGYVSAEYAEAFQDLACKVHPDSACTRVLLGGR